MIALRSSAAAIPVRRRFQLAAVTNDIVAIVVGTLIYLALGFVFHPLVIGLPAFGTPALGPINWIEQCQCRTKPGG